MIAFLTGVNFCQAIANAAKSCMILLTYQPLNSFNKLYLYDSLYNVLSKKNLTLIYIKSLKSVCR